jgi:hypothetical protein
MRSGRIAEARMSIRIFVPIPERRGATSSTSARRSMKKPLTESAASASISRRARRAP